MNFTPFEGQRKKTEKFTEPSDYRRFGNLLMRPSLSNNETTRVDRSIEFPQKKPTQPKIELKEEYQK